MKKIEFIITCIVLVGLNIFMIYKFFKLDEKFLEYKREAFVDKYVAESFRNTNKINLNGKLVIDKLITKYSTDYKPITLNQNSKNSIGPIFLFRANDCTNCITQTWDMVEQFYDVDSTFQVKPIVFFEKNVDIELNSFLSYHNLNMDVFEAKFMQHLDSINVEKTPQLIIYDFKRGLILDSYQPEPDNLFTRRSFYMTWIKVLNHDFQ